MSKIVILNGHPGTGKTYFLGKVLKAVKVPVVSKDDIKELIGNNLTNITLELSQELGRASFDLMHHFIEQMSQADANFIIEAPLKTEFESDFFNELYNKHKLEILQLLFVSNATTISKRLESRVETRHKIHADNNRSYNVSEEDINKFGFFEIPSIKIKVSTESEDNMIDRKVEDVIKFLER